MTAVQRAKVAALLRCAAALEFYEEGAYGSFLRSAAIRLATAWRSRSSRGRRAATCVEMERLDRSSSRLRLASRMEAGHEPLTHARADRDVLRALSPRQGRLRPAHRDRLACVERVRAPSRAIRRHSCEAGDRCADRVLRVHDSRLRRAIERRRRVSPNDPSDARLERRRRAVAADPVGGNRWTQTAFDRDEYKAALRRERARTRGIAVPGSEGPRP